MLSGPWFKDKKRAQLVAIFSCLAFEICELSTTILKKCFEFIFIKFEGLNFVFSDFFVLYIIFATKYW